MDNDLYRKEAIQNRKNQWSGNAFFPKGVSLWVVGIGTILFMSAIIFFLACGTYTRRVTVTGEIISEPRSVTVISPLQGFITKQLVNVGSDVTSGQALYLINNSKRTVSGVVNETQIKSINVQIQALQNIIMKNEENKKSTLNYIKDQINNYNAMIEQTKKNLKNSENGMAYMEKNMRNYRSYLDRGLINKEQLINQTSLFFDRQNDLVSYNNQLNYFVSFSFSLFMI